MGGLAGCGGVKMEITVLENNKNKSKNTRIIALENHTGNLAFSSRDKYGITANCSLSCFLSALCSILADR